jgi:DNA-binding MarR family transcriptional regulator
LPELERETLVEASKVVEQVASIEADGLVRRQHSSEGIVVALTTEGMNICEVLLPARARLMSDLGGPFSTNEKRLLNSLLDRFRVHADAVRRSPN